MRMREMCEMRSAVYFKFTRLDTENVRDIWINVITIGGIPRAVILFAVIRHASEIISMTYLTLLCRCTYISWNVVCLCLLAS